MGNFAANEGLSVFFIVGGLRSKWILSEIFDFTFEFYASIPQSSLILLIDWI